MTDNEISAALLDAAFDEKKPSHMHARRLIRREHFKLLYERKPKDVEVNPEAGMAVFEAISKKFGEEYFRYDRYSQRSGILDFPVRMRDGEIVPALAVSETLNQVPVVSIDYVFADRSRFRQAKDWLEKHRSEVIVPKEEEMEHE